MIRPTMFLLMALWGAGSILALALIAAASRHRKKSCREIELIGRTGSVESTLAPEGSVLIDGELWRARARVRIARGEGRVRVVGASGHLLEVERDEQLAVVRS